MTRASLCYSIAATEVRLAWRSAVTTRLSAADVLHTTTGSVLFRDHCSLDDSLGAIEVPREVKCETLVGGLLPGSASPRRLPEVPRPRPTHIGLLPG